MEQVMNKAKAVGNKAIDLAIGAIAGVLDVTSKGIGLLSSIIKGEKKININIEEVK